MERYHLQPNEVVLFKGHVTKNNEYKEATVVNPFSSSPITELLLTNLNIVLTSIDKKMFAKEDINIEIFPLSEIKIYNGIPQIKQSNTFVELYLMSKELYFNFESIFDATKCVQAVRKVLTGKSLPARSAEKVKKGIELVDDTLGINTVDTVKNVLENGVSGKFLSGFKKNNFKQNSTSKYENVPRKDKDIIKENQHESTDKKENLTYDKQIDTLNQMKALLDSGILTQEEFDTKKKEILGI